MHSRQYAQEFQPELFEGTYRGEAAKSHVICDTERGKLEGAFGDRLIQIQLKAEPPSETKAVSH